MDGVEESVGFSVLEASEEASKGVFGFVMEDEEEEGVSVTSVMLVSSILVIRGVSLPIVVE